MKTKQNKLKVADKIENINADADAAVISKKHSILYLIIVFCVPILLYMQTISFGLTNFDDDVIIVNNLPFLSDFGNATKAFLTDAFVNKSSPFYRPMQTLSYMLDIKLSGGNNPWMFHLSNILIFGFIACSLFLVLKRFLIPTKLAFISTLIFCANPLFVSSVAWIPARGDLLLSLFALLSFLFLMEYFQKGKTVFLIFHWISFTVALFCKETAVFLPVLFILYYYSFVHKKTFDRKLLINLILYAISGILWLFLRSKSIIALPSNGDVLGLINVFFSNLRTLPEPISVFFIPYDTAPIPAFSILKTLIGLAIVSIIAFLAIKSQSISKRKIIFCFTWFIALLAPTMFYKNPLIDYLDHRFYLPLIGVLLFILIIFPKRYFYNKWNKYVIMVTSAILVIFSSLTFVASRSYADSISFYSAAILQNPKSAIAYHNRGYEKSKIIDYKGAIEDFDMAVGIYPIYYQAYHNRGLLKSTIGDKLGAIADFDMALSINANYTVSYFHKGVTNFGIGNFKAAINDFTAYDSVFPNNPEVYNYIGKAMGSIGNMPEAVNYFTKAIEANPKALEAYGNRSIARLQLKDFTGAIGDCETVLKLSPNDVNALKLKEIAIQELSKIK